MSKIGWMTITCIRKARWVVAWDAHLQQHYFRNDVDVVFDPCTARSTSRSSRRWCAGMA
jgi:hypothetical protein